MTAVTAWSRRRRDRSRRYDADWIAGLDGKKSVMSRACGASGTPWFFGSVTDVPRVEAGTHLPVLAARCARALHERSLPRGSRECRGRAAPAVSCARCTKENAHEHTGSAEALRHSPRNGFTAYAALSPATNSSCHRHRRIEGFDEPGWVRKTSADLTPATGARTTRFCRTLQRRSSDVS
jgi:hypothetical protein